jgi:hypothetical protein
MANVSQPLPDQNKDFFEGLQQLQTGMGQLINQQQTQRRLDLEQSYYEAQTKQMQENSLMEKIKTIPATLDMLGKANLIPKNDPQATTNIINGLSQSMGLNENLQNVLGNNLTTKMMQIGTKENGQPILAPASQVNPSLMVAQTRAEASTENAKIRAETMKEISKNSLAWHENNAKVSAAAKEATQKNQLLMENNKNFRTLVQNYANPQMAMQAVGAATQAINYKAGYESGELPGYNQTITPASTGWGAQPAKTIGTLLQATGPEGLQKAQDNLFNGRKIDDAFQAYHKIVSSLPTEQAKMERVKKDALHYAEKDLASFNEISPYWFQNTGLSDDQINQIQKEINEQLNLKGKK